MHIPDGFLDIHVAAVAFVLAVVALGVAGKAAETEFEGPQAPLLGVTAAGIFAAQMLNWPLPGGTSAHFVGGAFAGILLGPHLGAIAVAAVVTVQALVFADGGIVVLGANLLNMAVVEVYVGYGIYRSLAGIGNVAAAFGAGWLASTLGAVAAATELGLSSVFGYQLLTTVLVMGGAHLLLGLIEGAITAVVYRQLRTARPDVIFAPREARA